MGVNWPTKSAGEKLNAADWNNARTDFITGKFFDNSGAGSQYVQASHNGTDSVVSSSAGHLRLNAPTGKEVQLEVNGTDIATFSSSIATFQQELLLPSGTVSVPAVAFSSDTDTGLGLISSRLALIMGGAVRADNNGTTWDFQGQALTTTSTVAANSGLKPKTSGTGSDAITHYEQSGTWTPALAYDTPGTSSFTYGTQVGRFSRIGNIVHFNCRIILTNYSLGTGTGNLNITGLPYASANVANSYFTFPVFYSNVTIPTNGLSAVGRLINNASSIQIFSNLATGANLVWDPASAGFALSTTSVIQLSGHYLV